MIVSASYKGEVEHKNAIAMKNYRDGKPLFTRAALKQFGDLVEGRETELTYFSYIGGENKATVPKKEDRSDMCVTIILFTDWNQKRG